MNAAVIAAVVSAAAALLVSALSFALNRRQQREADWRKTKFDLYREYVAALSGIIQGRENADAHCRYADTVNSLSLVASLAVLSALYAFQDEISWRSQSRRSSERHDALLNEVLAAMRQDLHPSRRDEPSGFRFFSVPPTAAQVSE